MNTFIAFYLDDLNTMPHFVLRRSGKRYYMHDGTKCKAGEIVCSIDSRVASFLFSQIEPYYSYRIANECRFSREALTFIEELVGKELCVLFDLVSQFDNHEVANGYYQRWRDLSSITRQEIYEERFLSKSTLIDMAIINQNA